MRISSVDGHELSSPIDPPQDRSFQGGHRRLLKRDFVLVVVETADGLRGFAPAGASSSAMREYFEDASHATFADVIQGQVADALEGEEVGAITDAHDRIDDLGLPQGLQNKAAGAIDVALHDIRGKEHGVPVYDLLLEDESDLRTDLPLYASAGMYMEPEGYAEQAAALDELGFFGYKYRPGIGPEGDRETVTAIAEAVEDIEIMLDAHTWWKLPEPYGRETVVDVIEHAGEHDAYWVEEPVGPDDYEGYRDLADRTDVPLAGGESEESPGGLLDLAGTGAVSFLQGDVRHHRGFTGCWSAIERCAGDDAVQFVPHNFGTWLGLIANAHLVAAAPDCELVEYPVFEDDPALDHEVDPGMYPFELAFDIIEGGIDLEDGRLTLPDEPGLGVDVDMDVVEEYPYIEGPWTEFHYDEE
ncbi:MAG: mandelate racemase/muconate lactonizing enzyme family protein [Halobacteriales archaeon]